MQYDVTTIPQCRNLIQFFIIVNGKNILHFKGTYMQNVHWNIIGFLGFGWNFVHLTHPPGSVMMASAFTLTNSNVITSPSVLKKKNQILSFWRMQGQNNRSFFMRWGDIHYIGCCSPSKQRKLASQAFISGILKVHNC